MSAEATFSRVYYALCKGADTPVSLGCWLRYKYGEHTQLVEKFPHPRDYSHCDAFERDYLVTRFPSKYTGLDTGIDKEAVAIRGWKAAELKCAKINEAFRNGRFSTKSSVESVITLAQRKIAAVLGPLNLSILDSGRWGPGATATLSGARSTLVDKIGESPISITRATIPFAQVVIGQDVHWCQSMGIPAEGPCTLLDSPLNFLVIEHAEGLTVPKSAKTDRTIDKAPTANVFFQLAAGECFKRRLLRVGVDLRRQELNRSLALLGSITGELVTLDLSAASDTISREFVRTMFPCDWADLLDRLRTAFTRWPDTGLVYLNKFSSMGNGFTFEVESLVFWSLAASATEILSLDTPVGIYGDDIIVSDQVAPLLIDVLDACGFSLNMEKSFVDGYFRESCGGHYWNGRDVTPIYQKEVPSTLPELYRLANRLLRYYNNSLASDSSRRWVLGAWRCAVDEIYRHLTNLRKWPYHPAADITGKLCVISMLGGHAIPVWEQSDDGLALYEGELVLFSFGYDRSRGVKLPVLTFSPQQRESDDVALLAYCLRFRPDEPLKGRVPVKRRGSWVTRRRWFSYVHFAVPECLDGAGYLE